MKLNLRIILPFAHLLFSTCLLIAQKPKDKTEPGSIPVFQVDFASPTRDKPQSKLWYMDDSWWAILPRASAPSLWQRTDAGWKEYQEVASKLRGIPGRVDVWADDQQVTAVGVADSSLTVFRLIKKDRFSKVHWESEILAELSSPSSGSIETATIAKDGKGNWWIAATADSKVFVWNSSNNGNNWTDPYMLAEKIDEDDICVITVLPGGIGVIWSDQICDAVMIREHRDGNPAKSWESEIVIEAGNHTADDHLNTSLSPDGTLWVATKNSVDQAGQPQFVLRIRTPDGNWVNKPYLILENLMKRPSRPIVVATEDNSYIFVGHGDNDRSVPYPYNSNITFGSVDTSSNGNLDKVKIVISPGRSCKYVVHNVTGPKHPFPANGPWIILASDGNGQVYETDLREMIQK